ncbi:MAG: glycosyltransferase [Candidatus Bathyarchaeales archaeon]
MNILILSELFYPHGGGAELATYLYARFLSKEEHNVIVVTNKFHGEPMFSRNQRLMVYRLSLLGNSTGTVKYSILERFDILFSGFMRKLLKWADIVYVPRYWFLSIPLAKFFGKPVIVHLHDYIPVCALATLYNTRKNLCNAKTFLCSPKCIYTYEKLRGRNFRENLASVALNSSLGCYLSQAIQLSDAVICVSKAQKDLIAQRATLLRHKLSVVYNPIPKIAQVKIAGHDFGYFGGSDFLKGFYVLSQAVKNLKFINSATIKIHATKFNLTNKQLLADLEKNGFLLYGKLNKTELIRIYEFIRSVIVPSIWPEPWPYVIVEALVQGRFVIASSVGGIPEQVEGCKGVKLFEAGNPCELADSIKLVSNLSRDEIVDLGMQNRETFLKRFDNESIIKGFINICEKLI